MKCSRSQPGPSGSSPVRSQVPTEVQETVAAPPAAGGGVLGAVPQALSPGRRVCGYELERELGRGGMGAVYLGRGPQGEAVALKPRRVRVISMRSTPLATTGRPRWRRR